jgi:DNA polymerase III epsilon subunit-like protein
MSKYIVFDVETTGLPKNYRASPKVVDNWPYIVQFAWIVCIDGKTEEQSFIIKPSGYEIPEDSIKIHQITNENALKNGIPIQTVLKKFKDDCNLVDFIVAHNASFDTSVILASCYRTKRNASFLTNKKTICTMKSTTNLCKLPGKYGYKYPKLKELFKFLFYKEPNVTLHNALEDTKVTLKCYKELLNKNCKMT